MQLIMARTYLKIILATFKLAAEDGFNGPLTGAKLALFKNNIAITNLLTWDDLVECDFTGYARSAAVVWADPVMSDNTNLPVIFGDSKTFNCTGSTIENDVAGFAIVTGATPPVLIASANFDAIIDLNAGEAIVLSPRVGFDTDLIVPPGILVLT
jgi:hypothetical protein